MENNLNKENRMNEIKNQLLHMQNILKDENEYKLQNNYWEENGELKWFYPVEDSYKHYCFICSHFNKVTEFDGHCDIYNKLLNLKSNQFAYCSNIMNCEAYDEIHQLNIIHSMDEMVEFIKKVENIFACVEDYEYYFGMDRKYDEETGEVLETIDEYYKRGGEFNNIPDKFPCVIFFDYNFVYKDLKWIYIGDIEKEN